MIAVLAGPLENGRLKLGDGADAARGRRGFATDSPVPARHDRAPRDRSQAVLTQGRAGSSRLAEGLMDRAARFPHLATRTPEEDAPHDLQDDRRVLRRAGP